MIFQLRIIEMPRIHSLYYQFFPMPSKISWDLLRFQVIFDCPIIPCGFFQVFQSLPMRKVWSYFIISRRWCFNIYWGALCNCIFINRQRGCSQIWFGFALSLEFRQTKLSNMIRYLWQLERQGITVFIDNKKAF